MILNRKSAKATSRVSLFVAVTMLSTLAIILESQGYQVGHIADNGVQMCKLGAVELFFSLLW